MLNLNCCSYPQAASVSEPPARLQSVQRAKRYDQRLRHDDCSLPPAPSSSSSSPQSPPSALWDDGAAHDATARELQRRGWQQRQQQRVSARGEAAALPHGVERLVLYVLLHQGTCTPSQKGAFYVYKEYLNNKLRCLSFPS